MHTIYLFLYLMIKMLKKSFIFQQFNLNIKNKYLNNKVRNILLNPIKYAIYWKIKYLPRNEENNLERKSYYKYLFLSGAIWNLAVGVIFFFGTIFMLSSIASAYNLEIPPSLVFVHGFLMFVFIIGIGLYIVSTDIIKYRNFAIMFIFEKFLVFIIFLAYFIKGDFNFLLVIPVIIDLFYGCLFLEYYMNFKKIKT